MTQFDWDDLHEPVRPSGEQLNYQHSPCCGSDKWKFYINPDTGGWKCFAGACDSGGYLVPQSGVARTTSPAKGTPGAWPSIEIPGVLPLDDKARRYLFCERGVPEKWQDRFGLCLSSEHPGRIIIPFFWKGELIYWTSRRYTSTDEFGPKHLAAGGKHPLWVGPDMTSWLDFDLPLVITEGPFDGMKTMIAGYPSVALCGSSLPRHLELMLLEAMFGRRIAIMLDGDNLRGAIKLANRLASICPNEVEIVALPDGQDPGGMTPEEIQDALEDA